MDIIDTLNLSSIKQDIVKAVIAMTPSPDSIPFNPASMFVKLAATDTAMGIMIKYIIPRLVGAIQTKGIPANHSKKSFSLDDNVIKSSTMPIIPTSRITSKVTIRVN